MDYKPIHKLRDLYPNPSHAIFSELIDHNQFSSIFSKINLNKNDAPALDMDYILNRSGDKCVSGLIEYLLSSYVFYDDGHVILPNGDRVVLGTFQKYFTNQVISNILYLKFYNKWDRLSDSLLLKYDVLSPYTMDVDDNTTEEVTNSGTDSIEGTDTSSSNDTITNDEDKTHKVYGFNSESGINADEDSTTIKRVETETSEDTTSSSRTFNNNGNSDTKRTITRKGNIGNKTFADLIIQEREQLQFQFFDVVYNDLDSVLVRSKWR